ncbi:MAG: extracellular solute-binding protein [Coriobacteriaceae bacterium]|nr:MAG: extracellular solute-binding protein [Coriobacteriaceae bacterium]
MFEKPITRKAFLSGAAAVAAGLGLAGCSGSSDSDSGSENGTVYWLNFKPEIDKTIQKLGKKYAKQKNVKVKIVTAASGDYEKTLTSEMDKSEAPTIFVIGNQAGVREWDDYALDLKGTKIAKAQTTDDYNQYDDDGKLVSVGYCFECYGIVANTDNIKKAGHSVDEIKDFNSFKTVVEDIHKNASANGFDAFAATDMDDSNSWRVTGHLANVEFFYEEHKGDGTSKDVWKKTPSTIEGTYLPNFKNLYDLIINNSVTAPDQLATGGHDPAQQFKDGKATFYLTGSWDYADITKSVKNTTMLPYYCGVSGEEKAGLNCGTENCWAINKNASKKDQQASMDFLMWLVTDEDASKELVEQLGIMPFKKAAESTNSWLKHAQELSDSGCYNMDWATNYEPNVDTYRAGLVSALNTYNGSQTDANWDKFKTAFVDGWATQYKKANA